MSRTRRYVCLISILLVLASVTAFAQYGSSLQGTVTDQSGAAVANAKVTAINQATRVSRDTVTNGSGFYRIPGLIPGTYTVGVEAPTFKKETSADVEVLAEAPRGLNVTLTPGPTQEAITVTGGAPTLETENASVADSISAQQVENLPSFGRDPYELLRLAPGIFGDSARGSDASATFFPNGVGAGGSSNSIYQVENQPQISANGQRVTENNFMSTLEVMKFTVWMRPD